MDKKWREGEDRIIYTTVKAEGITGETWAERLDKGYRVNGRTRNVLYFAGFTTSKIGTVEVAILKGNSLRRQTLQEALRIAKSHGLTEPETDIACLLRSEFSDKEIRSMGFSRIVPVHNLSGHVLVVNTFASCRMLEAIPYQGDSNWGLGVGFAFVKPKVEK